METPTRTSRLPWHVVGLLMLASLNGCTVWSHQAPLAPQSFVDDQPLQIDADFDLKDQGRLLQEIRNLKMQMRDDLHIPFSNANIRVRIYGNEAEFEQFLADRFPQLRGRRALFVVDGQQYIVYAVWSEQILGDLRHELTHAYLNSSVGTLPLWLDEGLAEYYEVAGVPGNLNREHLPWLTDGLARGTWRPNLQRLSTVIRPEEMTHVDYAEAWLWIHSLMASKNQTLVAKGIKAEANPASQTSLSELIEATISEPEQSVVWHLGQITNH